MKKRFFLIYVLCISLVTAKAQQIGIKAGYSLTNAKYVYQEIDGSTSNKTGFQIGLIGEIPISNNIYCNSGLLFSQKGTKYVLPGGGEVNLSLNYLDLPLNIAYKYNLGSTKIFAQTGPYLGYALSNKFIFDGHKESLVYGSDDSEMNRLDVGLNFGAGLEINKIQLGINYGLGLTNIGNSSNTTMKNRTLTFSIGILFGKN